MARSLKKGPFVDGKLLKKAGLPAKYKAGPATSTYYKGLAKSWDPLINELKAASKKNKK